jgi:hypothetical protein
MIQQSFWWSGTTQCELRVGTHTSLDWYVTKQYFETLSHLYFFHFFVELVNIHNIVHLTYAICINFANFFLSFYSKNMRVLANLIDQQHEMQVEVEAHVGGLLQRQITSIGVTHFIVPQDSPPAAAKASVMSLMQIKLHGSSEKTNRFECKLPHFPSLWA